MAILHMVKCPEVGGDTMWANMYKAYDELSPAMREFCESLSALHDAHPHDHPERMAIHPVIRVHPETGRRSLFVNEHFTRRLVDLFLTEQQVAHPAGELLPGFAEARFQPSPETLLLFTVLIRWLLAHPALFASRFSCTLSVHGQQ